LKEKLDNIYTQEVDLPSISENDYQANGDPDILLSNIHAISDQLQISISAHPTAISLPQAKNIQHM